MADLFGIDIAGLIASEIAGAGDVLPAKLIKITNVPRDPSDPTVVPPPKRRPFGCRGFVDSYSERQIDGTRIQTGDRIVSLLGATIANGSVVPEAGDEVEIDGDTFKVVNVSTDPARAVYDCQARV